MEINKEIFKKLKKVRPLPGYTPPTDKELAEKRAEGMLKSREVIAEPDGGKHGTGAVTLSVGSH